MKKTLVYATLVLGPVVAFATGDGDLGNIESLVKSVGGIVDLLIPIVVGIALLAFFWGLARYIFSAGDEDAKAQGRRIMIGGIIALFVIVSIWGIIGFIGEALGTNDNDTIAVPAVPGLGSSDN